MSLNPVIRALKELEAIRFVRWTTVSETDARRIYALTKAGVSAAWELGR
jgi:DNA-binding HxlR family transcriptional regulator